MAKYSKLPGKRQKAKAAPKPRPVYDYDIKVLRVLDGKYGVLVDLQLNNVTIYGCRLLETKDGQPFIGFPQRQDRKDKDKYWSIAYAPLTDEQVAEILKQTGAIMDQQDEDEEEV